MARTIFESHAGRGGQRKRRRGYSLIEVLMTVLIIQLISSMVLVNVSSVQSSEKLNRASEQVVVALRYARILAMSSGQHAGVVFDAQTQQIRVWQGTTANTVRNSQVMGSGGLYVIDLPRQSDISGVKIAEVLVAGSTTNPYSIAFGTLGGTLNNGYVSLTYAGQVKVVNVPLVGEPKVQ